MDFSLTKEEQLIQKMAREYAEKNIMPVAEKIDKEQMIPEDIIKGMGELGLFGLQYDEKYGGSGAGYVSYAIMMEQISNASASVGTMLSAHNLGLGAIDKFGTHEQKLKYMPSACRGEYLVSFAFTEPGTGTDPKSITTTAVKDGDSYIINGTKRFITNASSDGPLVIFAKDDQTGKPTAFIVEKNCEGYSASEGWEKVGFRGGDLVDCYLKNVRVPAENMLGEIGGGYPILQFAISFGKVGVIATMLGIALTAYEEAFKYAKEKIHRNDPITKFQAVQIALAEIHANFEAARWMTYRLGWHADRAQMGEFPKYASSTKIFVCDLCVDIVRTAMEIHGSYGLMEDYRIAMAWREIIFGPIVEGVPNVQKTILAGQLLR